MKTKEEMLRVLEGECERVLDALQNVDPVEETYSHCLANLSNLQWAIESWQWPVGGEESKAPTEAEAEAEPEPEAPAELDGLNEPDAPAEPKPEVKTYTKEEVREILGQAQMQHSDLDIVVLIQSFGVKQLSQLPPEKYPELLDKLHEAIGEA